MMKYNVIYSDNKYVIKIKYRYIILHGREYSILSITINLLNSI